jgi:dTDP-4-dehydrorhamnose reductase
MQEKKEISVVNDQVGSPTYAADLAEVMLQIINDHNNKIINWAPGIYHYSNAGVTSWFEFAQKIKEIQFRNCIIKPVSTAKYPTAAKRPAYSVLDNSKIQHTYKISLKNWESSLEVCMRKM